ncbi:hypothetical protein [Actinopolymorpha cephalotaxi]|uniref:Uncharacterized protein n=1 Tax=Actinopolymorpha cephalotaxi TaxID=504797 RepID=A0ABX2SDH7_9ACTN|nr:hypothetical protein [Actinopolymorpha cephalotaxi]NYH87304.1 hypothetical protein [Actinopolymorpha cephalotaxi]
MSELTTPWVVRNCQLPGGMHGYVGPAALSDDSRCRSDGGLVIWLVICRLVKGRRAISGGPGS